MVMAVQYISLSQEPVLSLSNKAKPRLCRGDSSSLTFTRVHVNKRGQVIIPRQSWGKKFLNPSKLQTGSLTRSRSIWLPKVGGSDLDSKFGLTADLPVLGDRYRIGLTSRFVRPSSRHNPAPYNGGFLGRAKHSKTIPQDSFVDMTSFLNLNK